MRLKNIIDFFEKINYLADVYGLTTRTTASDSEETFVINFYSKDIDIVFASISIPYSVICNSNCPRILATEYFNDLLLATDE